MRTVSEQLVVHRTGVAEVTGSNPVDALIFFRLLPSNCLNWKIYCDEHSSRSSTTAVQYEVHIYFTSFHCTGRYELNKLTSLPLWGFTAQLVEHRTGSWRSRVRMRWSPDIFQASFQLLKLENLLRLAIFTFIYNRNTIWISYIFHGIISIRKAGRFLSHFHSMARQLSTQL